MAVRTVSVKLLAEVAQYKKKMAEAAKSTKDVGSTASKAGTDVGAATGKFSKFGGSASGALSSVSGAAGLMGKAVPLGAGAAGAAMVAFAVKSVAAASDVNEQISATRTLFGDAADAVLAFGDSAEAIGLSKRAALEAANSFGDMFLKLGFTSGAAATLSEDFVRMAGDFASFKDLDPGEVLGKLQSGLSGEAEPLRALGIYLNDAAIKAEALTLGLGNAKGELSETEKVTARASLIMQKMGDAYGDVGRTADSYANTQRRAAAATENLQASIGQGFLPVFTDLVTVLGGVTSALATTGLAADEAEGSWIDAIPIIGVYASGLGKLADNMTGAAAETDYLTDSSTILANAEEYTAEQVEIATATIAEQEKAVEAAARAYDALLQAVQSQFSAEVAYARSLLGVQKALEDGQTALELNKDDKDDNNVSTRELAENELSLRDAMLGAGAAAVKQAEQNAEAAGKTLTEVEKFNVFRDALINLKEQFPELSGKIDEYLGRLAKVPTTKSTTVTVDGVDAAVVKVTALSVLLDQLAGKRTAPVVGGANPLLPRGLQPRAAGGSFVPGPLLVGERGPELLFPDRGGFVLNNRASLAAINSNRFADGGWVNGSSGGSSGGASGSGGPVDRSVHVTVQGNATRETAIDIAHGMRDAQWRSGRF